MKILQRLMVGRKKIDYHQIYDLTFIMQLSAWPVFYEPEMKLQKQKNSTVVPRTTSTLYEVNTGKFIQR